eukprot:scaffold100774_cov30-Tisochrysis_lutea.AAC.3
MVRAATCDRKLVCHTRTVKSAPDEASRGENCAAAISGGGRRWLYSGRSLVKPPRPKACPLTLGEKGSCPCERTLHAPVLTSRRSVSPPVAASKRPFSRAPASGLSPANIFASPEALNVRSGRSL